MNKSNKVIEQTVSLIAENDQQSAIGCRYEKPVLIAYGDVRDVTLGPTPGLGESGCECARRDGPSAVCPVICP